MLRASNNDMKNALLSILLLLFAVKTFPQSFKYRSYNYKWSSEKPASIEVEEQFKKHEAVILEERCVYNAGGVRVPTYSYLAGGGNYFYVDESSQGLSPIVEK